MSNTELIIKKVKPNVHLIKKGDQEIYLIGTAHVSKQSVDLVEEVVRDVKPDALAIELDEGREKVIKNKNSFENLNIIQILKSKRTFFFIGHLILSGYQKRISEQTGVSPGEEFRKSIELGEELNIPVHLIDREIGTTLKRAWAKAGFWGKMKLFASLFAGGDSEEVNEETIENLKDEDALTSLITEMGEALPTVKGVIIDERDRYLLHHLIECTEKKIVAVVGAGHVPGMLKHLEEKHVETSESLDEMVAIPKGNPLWKIIPWLIPVGIISIFVYGFTAGKKDVATDAALAWVLANGIPSAIGCLIAGGHFITVIVGFVAAPITSLNPAIGAGFVTGLTQAMLRPPRVGDFTQLPSISGHFKKWWGNRLTRVLLVFILSSLGSSIGTFTALPFILKILETN